MADRGGLAPQPPRTTPRPMSARLLFGENDYSPSAVDERVRRMAGGLQSAGVREDDVVCIMLRNEPAFVFASLAARLIGAYSCHINWHYKAEEAGWIVRDSGAAVLITDAALREQIKE